MNEIYTTKSYASVAGIFTMRGLPLRNCLTNTSALVIYDFNSEQKFAFLLSM